MVSIVYIVLDAAPFSRYDTSRLVVVVAIARGASNELLGC